MIDLHCHMLPGIDDGAPDDATALEMARIAEADGIRIVACTPHIYPGLYDNDANGIRARVAALQGKLDEAGIALKLTFGADAHLVPELFQRVKNGTAPTLHGGRYFLLEPSHHGAPPRFEESVFDFTATGYVPIITHPERLTWIEGHYRVFESLFKSGTWMQITAGSLTGRFGSRAKYWAERMLDDGIVHLLATDAHGVKHRAPLLAEGMQAAEKWVGAEEAQRLVFDRPMAILENRAPSDVAPVPAQDPAGRKPRSQGIWAKLTGHKLRF
jgi:protein-tyrosine phosphatase